ncbi:MAG TPA: single-stranded DNA-binding protein [Firmicutes bacterium]|nr:single-stranded DNA-binding protein [Bacillota bacterium]
MLNKSILIGRLVADPQLRYTQTGIAVTNFTLAVNRSFVSQSGEREADFIDIVVWRKLAETCANYLNKGRLVAVSGRLQIRSYEDQNGIRRKAAEVVADEVRFLDRARDSDGQQEEIDGPPEPEFDDVPF